MNIKEKGHPKPQYSSEEERVCASSFLINKQIFFFYVLQRILKVYFISSILVSRYWLATIHYKNHSGQISNSLPFYALYINYRFEEKLVDIMIFFLFNFHLGYLSSYIASLGQVTLKKDLSFFGRLPLITLQASCQVLFYLIWISFLCACLFIHFYLNEGCHSYKKKMKK